jgi:hypothetical protein
MENLWLHLKCSHVGWSAGNHVCHTLNASIEGQGIDSVFVLVLSQANLVYKCTTVHTQCIQVTLLLCSAYSNALSTHLTARLLLLSVSLLQYLWASWFSWRRWSTEGMWLDEHRQSNYRWKNEAIHYFHAHNIIIFYIVWCCVYCAPHVLCILYYAVCVDCYAWIGSDNLPLW